MWAKKYPPAFLEIIILREKEFYVLFYNISEKGFFYDDVELLMSMLKKSFQFPIYQKLVEAIAQQGTDDVRSCTGGSWWLSLWSWTSWSCTGESIIMQRRDVFVSLFVYLTRKRRDHIEYAWINMAVAWSTPYCCFYDTQANIGTLVDCLWYHQHMALHCKK